MLASQLFEQKESPYYVDCASYRPLKKKLQNTTGRQSTSTSYRDSVIDSRVRVPVPVIETQSLTRESESLWSTESIRRVPEAQITVLASPQRTRS